MEATQKSPDTIVIVSASIKQLASGRWVSTELTKEDDMIGAPGGQLRVFAAALLAKKYPQAMILVCGGQGYDLAIGTSPEHPTLAEIMRDELLDCGIPNERIKLETKTNSTFQQLQELGRLVGANTIKRFLLVTNRYHMSRIKAMIESKFTDLEKHANFELVSAEDLLISEEPDHWAQSVEDAYQSEFMRLRTEKEAQGVQQIKDGTYHFR